MHKAYLELYRPAQYNDLISEYLYRLRELELMYDGKIPIMVQERVKWPKKIGRNELCPCGSGKKYKRCHGRGEYIEFSLL